MTDPGDIILRLLTSVSVVIVIGCFTITSFVLLGTAPPHQIDDVLNVPLAVVVNVDLPIVGAVEQTGFQKTIPLSVAISNRFPKVSKEIALMLLDGKPSLVV